MLLIDKPLGMTPLDCIRQYQIEHPEYAAEKLGYAGRLDPMAEGLLLILVGAENVNREQFLGLDKEYEVEMLLGISTDTYDLLGLITDDTAYTPVAQSTIRDTFKAFTGDILQKYPPYSSKTVRGKPLYAWAREGRLSEIDIPEETRTIHRIDYVREQLIDRSDLQSGITLKLETVRTGDFRKDRILQSWNIFFESSPQNHFQIVTFKVACSSGTYMRSLVHAIGQVLSVPALTFSIKRTRIGDYTLSSADTIAHSFTKTDSGVDQDLL